MSAGPPLQRPAQRQLPPLPPRTSSVIPPSAAAAPPAPPAPPPPSPEAALMPLLKELLPLYLPERDSASLAPSDPLLSLVSAFASLFTQHHSIFLQPSQLEQHRRCLLPFPALCRHTAAVCPDFASELASDPVVVLPILSAAAHIAVLHLQQARTLTTTISTSTPITARITAHSPLTSIRSVRSHLWHRLVTFRANVVKVGPIRQLPSRLLFRCSNCKKETEHQLKDGRYSEPQDDLCQCPDAWRKLAVDRVRTPADDWQQVRLQEILAGGEHGQGKDGSSSAVQSAADEEEDEEGEEGQDGAEAAAAARSGRGAGGLIPRYFDCELRSDLVDSCMPGDVITVTGVIKPSQLELQYAGRDRRSGGSRKEWSLFLDVNALNTLTRHQHCSLSFIVITDPDLQRIAQVLSSTAFSPFKLLVHSLCPAIFGHELVKAGLLLTLLGGNSRDDDAEDGTSFDAPLRPTARSNPHILIVGDPGLGKSQMLKAVNAVSPRGVLVTGNTSTASGLTVTMLREGSADGGDYTLEAGALVLGDSGTTCVDEFDKLHASQHSALLEAMEQQTISIAKAGMIVTLPARTSVFAAANPQHGHYNRSRSVSENIKLPAPLLSRFDLVFVLVDDANECKDEALSRHVMKLHAADHSRQPSKRRRGAPQPQQQPPSAAAAAAGRGGHQEPEDELAFSATQFPAFASDSALLSSLRRSSGDGLPAPLPPSLLRLYIAYARRYIQPVFTDGAKSALYHFYLSLRQDGGIAADGPPITTRQLQSMIRLCQARAKAEMRAVVEEADARQVIELMRESLREVMEDEDGVMDWRRGGAGGRSGEKDVMRMMKALGRRLRLEGREMFSRAEVREMAAELGVKDVDKVIGQLNEGGWLLQQAGDRLRYREAD